MQPSLLQTPLTHGHVRCEVCQWRCDLAPGDLGRCRVRSNHDQSIMFDAYGLISGATIGPIEDHRLWHFFPDAQILSVGGFGTPRVPIDPSASIGAYAVPTPSARELSPERVVAFAQQRLCRGVLWTFGDPAVSFEWVLDGVKLGRAASRATAIATSGYFNPDAFALLAPYLDGMRLDVYGFSDRSYDALAGFKDWRTIFEIAAEARHKWNIHIEAAYQLAPGINDSDTEIAELATWMRETLGSLTPLHVASAEADQPLVERVQAVARGAGLAYVYGSDPHQATRCPQCTWIAIERGDGPTQLRGVSDDCCAGCHAPLGVRTSLFRRNVQYEFVA